MSSVQLPIDLQRFLKRSAALQLNERQERLLLGMLASEYGRGGIRLLAKMAHASAKRIRSGIKELLGETPSDSEREAVADTTSAKRIRKPGGGRKDVREHYPELEQALRAALEKDTYGNPMKVLFWTTLSLRKLADLLSEQNMPVSHTKLGAILEEMGYSKQQNQKMLQVGEPHPDRDAQFRYIDDKAYEFIRLGIPVISIDCKKKENIGDFKNNGSEYRPKGQPRKVLDHDFPLPELGKVAPYGVYVLNNNEGFINLGTSSDTAEFAGESVWRWWDCVGKHTFPNARKIYITCDGGGSNGCRVRLWKMALAKLAQRTGLEIHVSHFPPGTSKWNKIEHRLFCYITKNWAGTPLVDIQTVVNLIEGTTTTKGLKVKCVVDYTEYKKGTSVSDEEMDSIAIERDGQFGSWNYVVRGFKK